MSTRLRRLHPTVQCAPFAQCALGLCFVLLLMLVVILLLVYIKCILCDCRSRRLLLVLVSLPLRAVVHYRLSHHGPYWRHRAGLGLQTRRRRVNRRHCRRGSLGYQSRCSRERINIPLSFEHRSLVPTMRGGNQSVLALPLQKIA